MSFILVIHEGYTEDIIFTISLSQMNRYRVWLQEEGAHCG